MKYKAQWYKAFEHGSHRPYAALLYLGYVKVPMVLWENSYIVIKGDNRKILHMYAGANSFLIIYE